MHAYACAMCRHAWLFTRSRISHVVIVCALYFRSTIFYPRKLSPSKFKCYMVHQITLQRSQTSSSLWGSKYTVSQYPVCIERKVHVQSVAMGRCSHTWTRWNRVIQVHHRHILHQPISYLHSPSRQLSGNIGIFSISHCSLRRAKNKIILAS